MPRIRTDDLITVLCKISGVFVIPRNSTFTYKGKPVKVKQVAEELGVRYILEGSILREGDEIRINAQLVDALAGQHLWAERYDGTMGWIFALQDRIPQKIVNALAVKLTGSEKELVAKKGTDNVAALAMVYWEASGLLTPLKGPGVSWHEARLRRIQYLEKATEGPIAHSVRSQRYLYRRRHQEALSEMERALALDPNDPTSLYYMGIALTYAGSPKEAVEFFKRGMRLGPHNPSRYLTGLGRAHFCMEELEEAVGLYEKTMRLNPETATWAWGWCLAAFYALLGRDQEGRASSGPNTRRVFPRFQRKPADRRRDQEPAHRFDDHRVRFLSPAILDNVSEGWRIHLSGAWFPFF